MYSLGLWSLDVLYDDTRYHVATTNEQTQRIVLIAMSKSGASRTRGKMARSIESRRLIPGSYRVWFPNHLLAFAQSDLARPEYLLPPQANRQSVSKRNPYLLTAGPGM